MSNIVVLGMHRSGTSFNIGLLGKLGFYLGNVSETVSKYKPTGTQENLIFRQLNNQILLFNKASWDSPKNNLVINTEITNNIKNFSSCLPDQHWALKDPRMLLTYPIWNAFLPKHKIISSFRHPEMVAQSLMLKNGLEHEKSYFLWLEYNKSLITLWKKYRFPVLNFDLPASEYFLQFKNTCQYFDIKLSWDDFNSFYQPNSTKQIPTMKLSSELNDTYNQLIEISKIHLK